MLPSEAPVNVTVVVLVAVSLMVAFEVVRSVTQQANPLGAVIPGVITGLQVDEEATNLPAMAPPDVAEVVHPEVIAKVGPVDTSEPSSSP